jgi:hypothetical protein
MKSLNSSPQSSQRVVPSSLPITAPDASTRPSGSHEVAIPGLDLIPNTSTTTLSTLDDVENACWNKHYYRIMNALNGPCPRLREFVLRSVCSGDLNLLEYVIKMGGGSTLLVRCLVNQGLKFRIKNANDRKLYGKWQAVRCYL